MNNSLNIGALVPVRLTSERLPGKALQPIAGRPAITHLLERLFASRYLRPDRVVVCTTEDPSDDPLIPVVEVMGARVFRGSRDNIIDRFYKATRQFGFDAVIQADGDDPCTDTYYMDICMERLLADESLDVVIAEGLPLGLASKAIRARAIETVWEHHVTERNDTGFILYFTRTGLCRCSVVHPISQEHVHEEARLTLDYPEDLAFLRALFDILYAEGQLFGIEQIVATLKTHPHLIEINKHLNDEYWARSRALARLEYKKKGTVREVEW